MHEKNNENYWKRKVNESIKIAADARNCWNSKNDIKSKLKTNRIWNMIKMVDKETQMNCVYYTWVGMENS